MSENNALIVQEETILSKILLVRGVKVMIDRDLADLYGVTTKRLNEQVKRNTKRFPEDFMFQLTMQEKQEVIAKCDHLERIKYAPGLPYVFTEHGAVMLASVLNSDKAVIVNIQIVRVFIKMRQLVKTNSEILRELDQLQKNDIAQDQQILLIFEYLKQLEQTKQQQEEQTRRRLIGFNRNENEP